MLAFDLLRLLEADLALGLAKVHLAGWNGEENPVRVFLQGSFDEWQSWQKRKNFERRFVVSFIQLPERDRWVYAGVYQSNSSAWHEERQQYRYDLTPVQACSRLAGRLVVNFSRPGRQSYLNAETCAGAITVHELRAEPLRLEEFPGFKKVDLAFSDLEMLIRQNVASWRTVLSNVAGVYLISDQSSGKLYVGSATGEGGIWGRWREYTDGHGNNAELRKLTSELGVERAREFRFSILEVADVHASIQEILERESHWKRVLLTRQHGYNAN